MKIAVLSAGLLLALPVMPIVADEPARPRTPQNDAVAVPYSGSVTEVTKNSISILWPGEAKAKRFPVSETLAAGGFATEPRLIPNRRQPYVVSEIHRYRLADVMVGDQVSIQYAHLGDTDICDHICIRKRLNGPVSPLPDGAVPPKKRPPELLKGMVYLNDIPYHEWMNAYWSLEDKGIAYPEKFGNDRRWPVAPMPREVKPKP